MSEIPIISAVLWVALKTVSYAIWEIKNKNKLGGIAVIFLSILILILYFGVYQIY